MKNKIAGVGVYCLLLALSALADIIPVPQDDPRVNPEFAALGNMYQIGNFILSGNGEYLLTDEAIKFCKDRGGTVPNIYQWEEIAKAMGAGTTNGYNKGLTDMKSDFYWILGAHSGDIRMDKVFWGGEGTIEILDDIDEQRVRCLKVIK